jgi:hypothetical protein
MSIDVTDGNAVHRSLNENDGDAGVGGYRDRNKSLARELLAVQEVLASKRKLFGDLRRDEVAQTHITKDIHSELSTRVKSVEDELAGLRSSMRQWQSFSLGTVLVRSTISLTLHQLHSRRRMWI